MRQIESFHQLTDLSAAVRNRREGFITNFYPDPYKHQVWIDKGVAFFEECGKTVLIIKDNGPFWNIFYISTSIEELRDSVSSFAKSNGSRPLILDIVGRKEQCVPVVKVMEDIGFNISSSLVRMQRLASAEDDFPKIENVSVAVEEDLHGISRCLHEYFNERLEQIPYDEELLAYIMEKHVLIVKDQGRICGFLIFEKNASTLYLRYWFTKPEYREQRVGSKLLRQFFHEGLSTKRQILWVMEDNDNAVKRYVHYGFIDENMYDYIVCNDNR
ncbi:uncharacterized protein BN796_00366 [Alistipes sp. CAG:831]|nr:uncharacterized protein BN796_00366 [Alistipes sp. CAG:831]